MNRSQFITHDITIFWVLSYHKHTYNFQNSLVIYHTSTRKPTLLSQSRSDQWVCLLRESCWPVSALVQSYLMLSMLIQCQRSAPGEVKWNSRTADSLLCDHSISLMLHSTCPLLSWSWFVHLSNTRMPRY